jgi:signal transduction histidine kinase/HPt (histidine-containing phosphotransfer) domain-containing protein
MSSSPESNSPTRLLLIEDDPVDAQLIQRMLLRGEPRSFLVRHVSGLSEAVQLLKDGPSPDIVLLDLSLQDANRDEALSFIRELGSTSPVVVLTGNSDDTVAMEAARHGAQDYLVKWEFSPPFLSRSIRYAIERQQTERQLRAALELAESANTAKSNFLAMMSHEIRSPLNAVLGMTELLGTGRLDEEQRRYVGALTRAGRHLLHLVDDVLDLTRIESGRFGVEYQRFEVRPLIMEPVEFMQHCVAGKPIVIECDIDASVPPYLLGDPSRLKQVLVNLLGNAIKFTERGYVRLAVTSSPPQPDQPRTEAQESRCELVFSVTDSGIGIAQEHLSSIFDSFGQADASIARRFGGSGLGLTISKRLVELMGGKIWVNSDVGHGSTFSFTVQATLPSAEELLDGGSPSSRQGNDRRPSVPPPSSPRTLHLVANGERVLRLLLVDDAEDSALLVKAFLEPLGHRVDVANQGSTALDLLQSNTYDLVLMDVHMPDMDGYTVTSEIRRLERQNGTTPVPILFVTANTLGETRLRATVVGGTQLITKPITRQGLLKAIADLLGELDEQPLPAAPPSSQQDLHEVLNNVDRTTRPLLPRYLAARRADIGLMNTALQRGDATVIQTLGHNMKGSGASYGLVQVTQLGDDLEMAAMRKDWDTIAERLQVLEDLLERIDRIMNDRVTPISPSRAVQRR